MMGKMMKIRLSKSIEDETGQVLVIVLVLLTLGVLMIGPLLSFMSTGLIAGHAYENRMAELYAADAGIENAIWRIQTRADDLPTAIDPTPWQYDLTDELNSKQVNDTIEYIDDYTYKITSIATTDADSSTTIEAYIGILIFDFALENAITSRGDVAVGNNSIVVGSILIDGNNPDPTLDIDPNANHLDPEGGPGVVHYDPIDVWPTREFLTWFYEQDVKNLPSTYNPYTDATIDVKDNPTIESLKRYGDLDIINSGSQGLMATLNGTVYVTGNLNIGNTNQNFTLNMNGKTIFVEGEINGGTKLTLAGSGCIVALGDMNFQPHVSPSEDPAEPDFILVLSAEGFVNFQPLDSFYGAIVGDTLVDMQPNCYLEWVDPTGMDLNFPWSDYGGPKVSVRIKTWEIDLQ